MAKINLNHLKKKLLSSKFGWQKIPLIDQHKDKHLEIIKKDNKCKATQKHEDLI